MNDHAIVRLEELGVNLFRINLSHTKIEDLPRVIEYIQNRSRVPLCLDSEGAQIRTSDLVDGGIEVRENTTLRIHRNWVAGDARNFNLYPAAIIEEFAVGDFVSIDFDTVLVQVMGIEDEAVLMRVFNGGTIGQNRAVTVDRDIAMPPLTEKDRTALRIADDFGIRHFALSFANRGSDVEELRARVGKDAFVIAKIECIKGLRNLDDIAMRADALLIDRGDLARQLPIERIPRVQKDVIRRAKEAGVKIYVATNLLESMVSKPVPTRAEINDIYNTLIDGADGLVLAAETAIGDYPVRCASMIVKVIHEFGRQPEEEEVHHRAESASLLVRPHGGRVVDRQATASDAADIGRLPVMTVDETDLMDCEQIAFGTYSPITGFMDRETLESVLDDNRLTDGTVWTMPVVLQCNSGAITFGRGDRIALAASTGRVHALLDVSDVYPFDREAVTARWFGTTSLKHPGVARVANGGDKFVAGDILLVERQPSPHRHYELTPAQIRLIFTHKGWDRVVGFHTRNPAHRVHEHLQINALETTKADGLFINPIIGPKKPDDFLPDPIMKSYQLLLELGVYPERRVLLGSFATYPRYAGPREAVFTALCRKNMGCSHFVIGRDHTGVGNFYASDANRRAFEALGDIGVTPVFFNDFGYNASTCAYEEKTAGLHLETISGTLVRESLHAGRSLPNWFMREIVQEWLRAEIAAGRPIFSE